MALTTAPPGSASCRGPHQEASVCGLRAPQALRPSCRKGGWGAAGQLLVTESPHRAITFGLFPGLAATQCL